jgi:hypothetical protein
MTAPKARGAVWQHSSTVASHYGYYRAGKQVLRHGKHWTLGRHGRMTGNERYIATLL